MTPGVYRLRERKDFENCVNAYHDTAFPGDTLTHLYVIRQTEKIRHEALPPGKRIARLMLNGYLRVWGGMGRVLGSEPESTADLVLDDIVEGLRGHWKQIRTLQDVPVWDVDPVKSEIKDLFEGLHVVLRGPKATGRVRSRCPVGVGKLLHIILPNLCIIWDREHVIVPGLEKLGGGHLRLSPDAESYVEYLTERARQFRSIADSEQKLPDALARDVEGLHAGRLQEMFPMLTISYTEPLTKLLDEINYLR